MSLTPHQAKYFAHDLTRRAASGMDRLSMSLFDAAVGHREQGDARQAAEFLAQAPGAHARLSRQAYEHVLAGHREPARCTPAGVLDGDRLHRLREPPDLEASRTSERLIDGELVDERTLGRFRRRFRADEEYDHRFIVVAEIVVAVVDEAENHLRQSGRGLAHFEVVAREQSLGDVAGDEEQGGSRTRIAHDRRHAYSSSLNQVGRRRCLRRGRLTHAHLLTTRISNR